MKKKITEQDIEEIVDGIMVYIRLKKPTEHRKYIESYLRNILCNRKEKK